MDETMKPVKIPQEYSIYAETNNIYSLFKDIMQELIIWKPKDPLSYIVEYLQRTDKQRFRILVIGPPCSGKQVLTKKLSLDCNLTLVSRKDFLTKAPPREHKIVQNCIKESTHVPSDILMNILKFWFSDDNAVKNGWIVDGLIENEEQARALSQIANYPTHCIILDATDDVLIERGAGKLVHQMSGDVYHSVFDMPKDQNILSKLIKPKGYSKSEIIERLESYKRHIQGLKEFFKNIVTVINVDMSKNDVYARVLAIASQQKRNHAPRTPRIILIGPPGGGKKTQANLLAQKYKLNKIILEELIDREIVNKTVFGKKYEECIDKNDMDDDLILDLIEKTIGDMICETCGWILIGYPNNEEQATKLEARNIGPNRVFLLDVSDAAVYERLTQRAVDPISGYRYHLKHRPPPTTLIKDRLETLPSDNLKAVEARLDKFRKLEAVLDRYYSRTICKQYLRCQHINGEMDIFRVFESLESAIVEPVPTAFNK